MELPSSMFARCTFCEEESICRVIKSRKAGKLKIKALLKCSACGKGFDVELELPKMVTIRTIISRLDESERTTIQLPEGHDIVLGDEIMIGDTCVQVMGIEVGPKRLNKALAENVDTLWTRYFNELLIKVSINLGRTTQADAFLADPDDEFVVNEDIEVGGRKLFIYKIKTHDRILHRSGTKALARDLMRLYCKPAKFKKKEESERESD
ncbi:MAG: hypothetical protein KAS16_01730 [Thermoplasmata archaeon]|nr:hypothetical protein [Thermoplasmata archaeon]